MQAVWVLPRYSNAAGGVCERSRMRLGGRVCPMTIQAANPIFDRCPGTGGSKLGTWTKHWEGKAVTGMVKIIG